LALGTIYLVWGSSFLFSKIAVQSLPVALFSAMRFLTAGESHGPALVVTVEGMPAGLPILADDIAAELNALPKIAESREPDLPAEAQRAFERELSDKLKPLGYQAKVQVEANRMTNDK